MQQNRAVLDHQQFDFVVRMMNCCLQVRRPARAPRGPDTASGWGRLCLWVGTGLSCPEPLNSPGQLGKGSGTVVFGALGGEAWGKV